MTSPNKNEGLIARLDTVRTLVWPTPDGPVTLQWPVKITAQNAREAFDAVRVAFASIERVANSSPPFAEYEVVLFEALASTADGDALRPSASVPAGAVIQGEDNRQEREE